MDRKLHSQPEANRGLTLFRIVTGLRTRPVPLMRDEYGAAQSESEDDSAPAGWSDSKRTATD